MTPKLVVNENFPAPSTQVLRSAGIDVLAIGEVHPLLSAVSVPGGEA